MIKFLFSRPHKLFRRPVFAGCRRGFRLKPCLDTMHDVPRLIRGAESKIIGVLVRTVLQLGLTVQGSGKKRCGRRVGELRKWGLVLVDAQTQKWSPLAKVRAAFPNWSRDGQYVYFVRWLDNPAVLRVRITDHEVEHVSNLTNLPPVGNFGPWLGLAPDDSLLLLKDMGSQDIYALDWEEP
jgi:hypothetical protein